MGKKPFAFGRQFDTSGRAMKDGDADLLLKLPDLHAHGRLRAAELFCGHPEAAIFGHRNEHMKKLEIDRRQVLTSAGHIIPKNRSILKIILLESIVGEQ